MYSDGAGGVLHLCMLHRLGRLQTVGAYILLLRLYSSAQIGDPTHGGISQQVEKIDQGVKSAHICE